MNNAIACVYRCYLGSYLFYRAAVIYEFVKNQDGVEFFLKYSTEIDSILNFIRRCEDKDLL